MTLEYMHRTLSIRRRPSGISVLEIVMVKVFCNEEQL